MMLITGLVAGFVFGLMTAYVLKNDDSEGGGFIDPDEWDEDIF